MKNKVFVLAVIIMAVTAFSMTACLCGKRINSAEELKEYLDSQPANSSDKPIKVSMNVNNLMIKNIAEIIESSGKYVSLNLSRSTELTAIDDWTFQWTGTLVSIKIPDSVISIGSNAFSGCTSLESVTMGNSVTSIGDYAFGRCASLTSITIPNSITSIGEQAFVLCSSLTNATIGNSVTSIGEAAFYGSSLTSVKFLGTIPSSGFYEDAFSTVGDLRDVFYAADKANGTPGTYTKPDSESETWTKKQ